MASTRTKTATKTHSGLEQLLVALLAGMNNDLPATIRSLTLEGQAYTPAQVDQVIQKGLDGFANVRATKAAYAAAVAANKAVEAQCRSLAHALVAWLKLQFGSSNAAVLAKFGVILTAPKKVSAGTKAVSAAKAKATRQKKNDAAALAAAQSATPITVSANGVQLSAPAALVPGK